MTTKIARYIALPAVSAGILAGAALGLSGVANAAVTTTQNGPNTEIVATPDTYATPAPNAMPGWYYHHGYGHAYLFDQ
ncbi:hypothetical protein CQY20_30780 [Mycolicibacterium agri]|uniref:DUF2613 domain-containing protein n=1 Tax=Mycolicibacterium agri TaxID=36811 RepID=A0A2A7MQ17_MYCAG|nr:hypothetical protein [Mycolicibacterium agri]PEG33431.1 hypothetical protein CQY20_30780 [Mycolicibacterium agri]GFG53279.1 hypothetical protein MAGR_47200 [Mycolicibacterium agri]